MADDQHVHAGLVNADDLGLPEVPGVELPTVPEHTYPLDDYDNSECRIITEHELDAAYVDHNIVNFSIVLPDIWSDIDAQVLTVDYASGRQYQLTLHDVQDGPGSYPERYLQWNGVIVATDANGTALLDTSNTPNLAYIKSYVHEKWREVQEQRLEIAEMVAAFAEAIGHLSHASHLGGH